MQPPTFPNEEDCWKTWLCDERLFIEAGGGDTSVAEGRREK